MNTTNNNSTNTCRPMPHDATAEKAVLSVLLQEPDRIRKLCRDIGREYFYDQKHQAIWHAIESMVANGQPVDLTTVTQRLDADKHLDAAGGAAYVTEVFNAAPTAASFDFHVTAICEKHAGRRAIEFAEKLTAKAYDASDGFDEILCQAKRDVTDITAASQPSNDKPWLEFVSPDDLAAYQPPEGYRLVGDNHITRGLPFVIGGPPGVGKSRSAVALALAGATRQAWFGLPVHRPFKTMILQNENGRHRLKDEFAELDATALRDFVRISPPPPYGLAFDRPEFCDTLAAALAEFKPDVFILDPWNAAARDDKQKDYLEALNLVRSVLPAGDDGPALGIIAHTRKPTGEQRRTGRGLLNDVAGSYVLVSVPRCVFVMLAASDDTEDDRVVWTCSKNNDGPLGPRSAWHRRNGLFVPVADFDWNEFDAPPDNRKTITEADMVKLFDGGKVKMARKQAVAELERQTDCGKSACYAALKPDGKFAAHLDKDGDLICWKP